MAEELVEVGGGIALCAERFGDPADPAVLLVMGLGEQMVRWHEDFVAELTGRGLHVVRFDNRDAGRSTFCDEVPLPTLAQLARKRFDPRQYTLHDMARDTAGLVDALGLGKVHVVGASMGGMIAQLLAAEHPRKVRSLTSIMSNTGARFSGRPSLRIYPALLRRPPRDKEGWIARQAALQALIGSPGIPADEAVFREIADRAWERNHDPRGTARQLAAIQKSGDRTALLHRISAPTLVIHGEADRMVALSGGRATARAIPGAELLVVPGMGHDLPRAHWPEVIGAIAHHVSDVERGRHPSVSRGAP